jgi:hypothetical protein
MLRLYVLLLSVLIISEGFTKGYKIPGIENDDFAGQNLNGVMNIDW